MTEPIPQKMTKELRHQLASAISDAKAYEVPNICNRLRLRSGESAEAFSSKYKYAQTRISEISVADVIIAARVFLAEEEYFQLSELLAKIDEIAEPQITILTRRRIISLFDARSLVRNASDVDFIKSILPIANMPPPNAGGEANLEDYLFRQMFENDDLKSQQILEYIGIVDCSRRQFERFLVAVTAPECQGDDRQTAILVEKVDQLLRKDGYSLSTAGEISGSPVYSVKLVALGSPSDSGISTVLSVFEPSQVLTRWQAALNSRENNPERAITLARTLLEDVCKWILHEAGEIWQENDDLPALYGSLAKVLKLAPDDYTEKIFKQILGNCQSIVQSLGALRNKLGDAHSVGPRRSKPQSRHAELAVNLAGAMASFLVSTWEARNHERTANIEPETQ